MGLLANLFACMRETQEERIFNEQLKKDGLKVAISRASKEINNQIPSTDLAIKFVLQELDFSRKEEAFPEKFIFNSGFHQLEYEGALDRFSEDEVELGKIQTLFDNFLGKIKNETEMVETSMTLIDDIMSEWKIGKYSLARVEKKNDEDLDKEAEVEAEKETIDEKRLIEEHLESEKNPPKSLEYDSKRVTELLEEYSDIISNVITGEEKSKEQDRIEAFKKHISDAALEGRSHYALVLSCFYEHDDSYTGKLPIDMSEMNDESLSFFMSILKRFSKKGFSDAFIDYMKEHRDEVYQLAEEKNSKYLQYLIASWYEDCDERRDDDCLKRKREWYEKSALNGFVPAILRMGDLYNEGSQVSDEELKRSAYWYREGALRNSSIDMYNLATLYAHGEGVNEKIQTAQLWFSLAYQEGSELLKEQILKETKALNIELFDDPSFREDPELNPKTAELSGIYT